jgi:hypothetical protein
MTAMVEQKKEGSKTYNSGYSPVVTHLTTNPPVHCLSTAERTGSSIFSVLWSYVEELSVVDHYEVVIGGGVRQGYAWSAETILVQRDHNAHQYRKFCIDLFEVEPTVF